MARPLHLPEDFTTYDFLSMINTKSNGRKSIRLLAMHHIQLGKSLVDVAEIVGVHCKCWRCTTLWSAKENNWCCRKMVIRNNAKFKRS